MNTGAHQTHRDSRGLTLLELLVVVGIIAVLAAMVLPAVARTKAACGRVVCLNNLKQWGLATHLHAADNDDFLPPDGSPNGNSTDAGWYIDLPRTVNLPTYTQLTWPTNASISPDKSIWVCPSSTNKSNGNNLFFYCLNREVNGTGTGNHPVRITSILHQSRTVWLFDNGKRAAVAKQNNVAIKVHNEGAQFLFLDGHGEHFRNTQYWDFSKDRGLTNNPNLLWVP
jgi:prepilin-type N-terminal cleavage/methylation domain-containing protein/prepilin-type processing-associated H-X9-DG protein